jgi:hypothetical protein
MINSSTLISECYSYDTLNDIQTTDLVPQILDDIFFKFKMSDEFDKSSEDSVSQKLLDLNDFLETEMSEVNKTQVFNIVKELEEWTTQNLSSDFPIDGKFLITEFIFSSFNFNFI